MKSDKKARLQRAGWVVGDAAQFLKLSAQEQRFCRTEARARHRCAPTARA